MNEYPGIASIMEEMNKRRGMEFTEPLFVSAERWHAARDDLKVLLEKSGKYIILCDDTKPMPNFLLKGVAIVLRDEHGN